MSRRGVRCGRGWMGSGTGERSLCESLSRGFTRAAADVRGSQGRQREEVGLVVLRAVKRRNAGACRQRSYPQDFLLRLEGLERTSRFCNFAFAHPLSRCSPNVTKRRLTYRSIRSGCPSGQVCKRRRKMRRKRAHINTKRFPQDPASYLDRKSVV